MLFFDCFHLRETRFSGIEVIRKAGVIEQKSENRKLVRQSQIVQNAMYSHMYDPVIITQFVNNSCHSLLLSEGF